MMMVLMTVFTSAFLTLHESTLISSTQSSMGPHQTSILAILQPISDAFKLITKSTTYPSLKMVLPPIFCLILTLLSTFVMFSTKSILPFYAIQSLTIYAFISTAIYSSSSYTMISMPSIISQLISYEILYSFLIFAPFISTSAYTNPSSLYNMFSYSNLTSSPFKFTIIPFILFITILAETNSTPFDLPESESELVAGFLTEYSAIPFMIYQLTEYMSIVVSSFLIYSIYSPSPSLVVSSIMSLLIMSLIILSSTTFPSFKYSSTISLSWKDLAILTVVLPLMSLYWSSNSGMA